MSLLESLVASCIYNLFEYVFHQAASVEWNDRIFLFCSSCNVWLGIGFSMTRWLCMRMIVCFLFCCSYNVTCHNFKCLMFSLLVCFLLYWTNLEHNNHWLVNGMRIWMQTCHSWVWIFFCSEKVITTFKRVWFPFLTFNSYF